MEDALILRGTGHLAANQPLGAVKTSYGSTRRSSRFPPMDAPIANTFDEFVAWMAANSPSAAILEWWRRLDRALDDFAAPLQITKSRTRYKIIEAAIARDPELGEGIVIRLQEMRRLRNRVAHDPVLHLSQEEVFEYARQALHFIWEIGARRAPYAGP